MAEACGWETLAMALVVWIVAAIAGRRSRPDGSVRRAGLPGNQLWPPRRRRWQCLSQAEPRRLAHFASERINSTSSSPFCPQPRVPGAILGRKPS